MRKELGVPVARGSSARSVDVPSSLKGETKKSVVNDQEPGAGVDILGALTTLRMTNVSVLGLRMCEMRASDAGVRRDKRVTIFG